MAYWVLRWMGWMVGFLPIAVLPVLAQGMAVLAFDVFRLRRRLLLENLTLAFGNELSPGARTKLARRVWFHSLLTAWEVLRSQRHDIIKGIEVEGREHVEVALAKGHGVILLVAHIGNWEAFGAYMSRIICPTHVLVKPIATAGVDRYVQERRRNNGMITVDRRRPGDGLRAVIRAIRAQEIVGFIMDQSRPGEPKLPFFGKMAKTNTSLAAIWQRYPVPVIPAYIERLAVGRHRVHLRPPLELPEPQKSDGEILQLTSRFNQEIESMVRSCPEQYLWMHNRWKA